MPNKIIETSLTSEVSDRPRRRTFTAEDKLRILAETDQVAYSGEGGQAFHLKADSDSGRRRTAIR